jgi:hypothetical protein
MLLSHGFDAGIINNKGKENGADHVGPESMCVASGMVAIFCEMLDKSFIGDESCLGQPVHDLSDSDKDRPIVFHDASWNGPDEDGYVFVVFHWRV